MRERQRGVHREREGDLHGEQRRRERVAGAALEQPPVDEEVQRPEQDEARRPDLRLLFCHAAWLDPHGGGEDDDLEGSGRSEAEERAEGRVEEAREDVGLRRREQRNGHHEDTEHPAVRSHRPRGSREGSLRGPTVSAAVLFQVAGLEGLLPRRPVRRLARLALHGIRWGAEETAGFRRDEAGVY